MSGGHLSKEFFELVKCIGESRSKQEEDKIIVNEIVVLKSNLNQANITPKKMKEYMIRAIYVEMLGHDASFAYIHAVKLTHEKSLLAKRIGYLTCNLFLHKDHELMLLLINTMQRDLNSPNHLEVSAALTSVSRLVNLEMIPAISPLVFKLLTHPQEMVRKKAIVCVYSFNKIVPETVRDQKDAIRKVLCDPDPAVMGASLHILYEFCKSNPSSCKDLVASFVSILKQITENRLPRDFDYHRLPAPWIQIRLLSILGVLGTADQKASEQMHDILQECMRRADNGGNVGFAIIYEAAMCIAKIYPDRTLMEAAASNISRFISSDNHNLKYLGITGLSKIVQVNPIYASQHQTVVVDCLDDPDDTLKRKTLELLYRMTNPENVEIVVDRLTFYLRTSVDMHLRRELVQRITSIAERFAPNNEWYVHSMNTVFELGGDLVPAETAYNLMRLVAEGTGEDEAMDQQFRTFAVNTYLKLLEKSSLSDILVQVVAWVLGEYARLASLDGYTLDDIVDLLCETIDRPFEDSSTRGYIVNALMKLVGQSGLKSSSVDGVIKSFRSSRLTDLQQRCYEFEMLQQSPGLMRRVLPYDASCEDITINTNLGFLDGFVRKKVQEGAKLYQDAAQRAAALAQNGTGGQVEPDSKHSLNFQPYKAPDRPMPGALAAATTGIIEPSTDTPATTAIDTGLNIAGPRKWGPAGYNNPDGGGAASKPSSEQPASAPASTPESSIFAPPARAAAATGGTTSAKPEVQPELTEKQKMAAALFSGLGGPKAAPAPKPAPGMTIGAAPAPPPAQPPQAKPPPEPVPPAPTSGAGGAMTDLLDLDDTGPPSAGAALASAPAPSPQGVADDMLLLDMGESASAPTPNLLGGPPQAQPSMAAPILGPLPTTTAQVGQMWAQLASERRLQIGTSLQTSQAMMERLQTRVNVHPVQIIGMEGIAAGRVLPGNEPCFLHGKLRPPQLDVIVRCRDAGVAERVVQLCTQALA